MTTRKAQLEYHYSYNLYLPDIKGGGEGERKRRGEGRGKKEGKKEIDSKSKRLQREVKKPITYPQQSHDYIITKESLPRLAQN